MHRQVVNKKAEEKAKLELACDTKTQNAKFEHQNYQSSVNSNRHESKDDEKKRVLGICRKVRLEREASPNCHQSPGGKIAGWNENGYSPTRRNREGNGRAQERDFVNTHPNRLPRS